MVKEYEKVALSPACLAAGIKIEPSQGDGYHIEKMKNWIDDGKNSVMIWGRVKNTKKNNDREGVGYWADVVARVVDDGGEGEEIARYHSFTWASGRGLYLSPCCSP